MKRRNWTSTQKFKIVLEGLKGETNLSELCNRYQISQTQYYKWRDKLLKSGKLAFEQPRKNREIEGLKKEIDKLKLIIGDLTTELKKIEYEE